MSGSLEARLFLGYLMTGEIGLHLSQSSQWNRSIEQLDKILEKAYWQEKDYIGLYIQNGTSYDQIRLLEQTIKRQLQLYCSKLNLDKHKLYLFPQIFLS